MKRDIYFLILFVFLSSCSKKTDEVIDPIQSVDLAPIEFNSQINYGTISDLDANIYKTVTIGTQVWMAENLKTTKYNDGTAIPFVTIDIEWSKLTTSAYSWYDNDKTRYKNVYGAIYNWYSAGSDKICPTGWHVPSDQEWTILTSYLNSTSSAKLKEVGTTHWMSPNKDASNISGFTALPSGGRGNDGGSGDIGAWCFFWTSTEYQITDGWERQLTYSTNGTARANNNKRCGASVRCVKD